MNKKLSLGVTIGLMALTAAVTFIITYNYSLGVFNEKVKSVSEKEGFYTKLAELDKYVRANYFTDLNEEDLLKGIITGYISGLDDPYATYYTEEEYAALSQKETGVATGLGFNYKREESGYIVITDVTESTSAADRGLVAGDVITAVNNTDVIAFEGGYDAAVKLFTCAEGTKVKLHIKRITTEGIAEFFSIDVISSTTEIVSVTSHMIDTRGYIKISSFNDKTPEQFKTQLDTILSQGATSLILDLRGNSSERVSAMGDTVDYLLGAGQIVTAKYKDKSEVIVETTEANQVKLPMVVLVDNNTASCGELFAFALRDNAGAQTVGMTTFGKGVMQVTNKLTDGSAVRISVAVLQTEKSGDFNGVGMKPQFEVALPPDVTLSDLTEENHDRDTQLQKAIEVADTIQ